jgi:hypothetical protein
MELLEYNVGRYLGTQNKIKLVDFKGLKKILKKKKLPVEEPRYREGLLYSVHFAPHLDSVFVAHVIDPFLWKDKEAFGQRAYVFNNKYYLENYDRDGLRVDLNEVTKERFALAELDRKEHYKIISKLKAEIPVGYVERGTNLAPDFPEEVDARR